MGGAVRDIQSKSLVDREHPKVLARHWHAHTVSGGEMVGPWAVGSVCPMGTGKPPVKADRV